MSPGDVVVCIDASPPRWHEPRYQLTHDAKYFVTAYGRGWPRDVVELAGVPRHRLRAFDARRFRPLRPGEYMIAEPQRTCATAEASGRREQQRSDG